MGSDLIKDCRRNLSGAVHSGKVTGLVNAYAIPCQAAAMLIVQNPGSVVKNRFAFI
jgi:hypothetical protein